MLDALNSSNFTLDIASLTGLFGGDVAVNAMTTVYVWEGRKWLGWYNSPGSYEIAKAYGQIANSRFWDGLFPGPDQDPAFVFELDGQDGPAFHGVHTGTEMPKTGHAAYLLAQVCKQLPHTIQAEGRRTTPIPLSIVRLEREPPPQQTVLLIRKPSEYIVAFVPILSTIATAAACAVFRDWFCFSAIVLGMLASGVSCVVIGSGTLLYTRPRPPLNGPPGDGILDSGSEVAVLLGSQAAVHAVTRGAFSLSFNWQEPTGERRHYHAFGACSLLLTTQFIAQLLLVPQGTLFGQIMFLVSLIVAFGYNLYLCSINRWEAQRRILMEQVLERPTVTKVLLQTRASLVVFVLLVLTFQGEGQTPGADALREILDRLLPVKGPVWEAWKEAMLRMVVDPTDGTSAEDFCDKGVVEPMPEVEKSLLNVLFRDADNARAAFDKYRTAHHGKGRRRRD